MNPNIKVINDKIWMTSFILVGMNNIQEMCIKGTVDSKYFMAITKGGQYLLNSDNEYASKYLPYLKIISTFPNRLIDTKKGFCSFVKVVNTELDKLTNEQISELLNQNKLNGLKAVFETVCTWEKTRREIKNYSIERG